MLVLLHAYPLNSHMWDGVIEHLHAENPGLAILTLDAPGFGESPTGPEVAEMVGSEDAPSLETFALAIEETLEHLGIEQIVLAGLSLGGYAALAYAEEFPDRLRGFGLLDTKAEADEEPARKVRLATAAKVVEQGTSAIEGSVDMVLGATTRATLPQVVDQVRHEILAAPPEAVAWIQRAMAARPDRMHVLEELQVPALVLRGEEDELSSERSAQAMALALGTTPAMLGASGVVTLPRVGHMSANEAPAEVASALTDLCARAGA